MIKKIIIPLILIPLSIIIYLFWVFNSKNNIENQIKYSWWLYKVENEIKTNSWEIKDIEYTISWIDSIKTNSDLEKINPLIISDFKFNSEEFLNFNKNQMKLWLLISEIKDEEYLKLKNEQILINEAREIWTDDIKKIDEELKSILLNNDNISSKWNIIRVISNKKSIAIKEFQKSEEYKNYIISKKDRLTEIDILLSNYYSLEILDLKNKIDNFILSNTWSVISNNSK